MSMGMFFGLLGGLALFLYGMQMMSVNLEAAAGSRMKAYSGTPDSQPLFRGMCGRRHYGGDSVLFRHNGNGGGLCQFRTYDA